jgi:hypothetical protein
MFALVNGQELILGPIGFNIKMINYELEELELPYRVKTSDNTLVPIHLTENVHILPSRSEVPEYDPRFETIHQVSHIITDDEVVFYYEKNEKSLEQIKNERKIEIAPIRRLKESTMISLLINNTSIQVTTDRSNRLSLVSKMISNDGPYNFKFDNNVWVEVTKEDLQYIVSQIDLKVQEAFDWEYNKLQEINNCTTKEDVYDVILQESVISPTEPEV